MIAYNITTKAPWDLTEAWLLWQRESYIPQVMATELFDSFKLFRLLRVEEEDGPTYVTQFFSTGQDRYEQFLQKHHAALTQMTRQRWEDQLVSFHTLMELVD